jgi:hypothetical protein
MKIRHADGGAQAHTTTTSAQGATRSPRGGRAGLLVACLAGAMLAATTLRAQQPVRSSAAESTALVERIASEMETRYVAADTGRLVAQRLRRAARAGAYASTPAGAPLASRLTAELRSWTGDGHLAVEHSDAPIPAEDRAAAEELERRDRHRYYGRDVNHGVRRFELRPGNVAYVELTVFAPLEWAAPVITAAMGLAAQADALIIDLRQNGGGHSETVAWAASYLLPRARPLTGAYHRVSDATRESWSLPWVPGSRVADSVPVYVLTSRRTFSAGEALAYDLQALGRATVVGERTGGGAHPYENVRLDAHHALALPTSRSINPVTGRNWQGVGVRPDVPVPAGDALAHAERLIARRLGRAP